MTSLSVLQLEFTARFSDFGEAASSIQIVDFSAMMILFFYHFLGDVMCIPYLKPFVTAVAGHSLTEKKQREVMTGRDRADFDFFTAFIVGKAPEGA